MMWKNRGRRAAVNARRVYEVKTLSMPDKHKRYLSSIIPY